jgi:hypothetical protein
LQCRKSHAGKHFFSLFFGNRVESLAVGGAVLLMKESAFIADIQSFIKNIAQKHDCRKNNVGNTASNSSFFNF